MTLELLKSNMIYKGYFIHFDGTEKMYYVCDKQSMLKDSLEKLSVGKYTTVQEAQFAIEDIVAIE